MLIYLLLAVDAPNLATRYVIHFTENTYIERAKA